MYVREVFTSLRNNNNKNGAQAIGRKTCSCLLQDINQRAIFLISSGTFTRQTGSSSSSTDMLMAVVIVVIDHFLLLLILVKQLDDKKISHIKKIKINILFFFYMK